MFDLHGKVALLIGHEGNLGPIWKETLENAGAKVWTWGLPQVDFIKMKSEDFYLDPEVYYDQPDIFPDIIVCNAAIDLSPSMKSVRFMTDFEQIIQVNLTVHACIIDSFVSRMISKWRRTSSNSVIVLIGSIQGYVGADWRNYDGGFEKPVAYNCSKAALQQLARSITVQYGRYGIRAVCPGFGPVETPKLSQEFRDKISPKIPMGRFVSKRSLQQTLLYACCCEDLAGEDWLVDGGYTKW